MLELLRLGKAAVAVAEGTATLLCTFTLPIKLTSITNSRGHWAKSSGIKATQRALGLYETLYAKGDLKTGDLLRDAVEKGTLAVLIVRISPKRLDSDNATASAKSVRDGIAEGLGVDDGGLGVTWLPVMQRRAAKTDAAKHQTAVYFYEVKT